MADNSVLIQVIIGISSVLGTYLTVKYKPNLINRIKTAPEQDRASFIFQGYEKLIKELQGDLDKTRMANEKQANNIEHMQGKIDQLQDKLRVAQAENRALAKKLSAYGSYND